MAVLKETRPSGAAPGAANALTALRGPDSPASLLLLALLASLAWACFAHGAIPVADEAPLQAWLALVAIGTFAVWLWDGGLRLAAPRLAWAGVALLAAFAAWTFATLAWGVAPDRTWAELNRAIAYALVAVLGIALGASHREAVQRIAGGYLLIAVAAALYALAGKIAPAVLDTAELARLRVPLDYTNALALTCALAIPLALRLAVDAGRSLRARLAVQGALLVLVVTMVLTYSRGGIVAAVAGVAVTVWLGNARVRTLVHLGLALVAAAPPLAWAVSRPDLTYDYVPVDKRSAEGAVLGLILLVALALLVTVTRAVPSIESRIEVSVERARQLGRLAALAAGVCLVSLLIGMALSERGLTGTISRQLGASSSEERSADPGRLLSASSGNRSAWWGEARGAWADRPVGGWGAGSFPVTHLYRREDRSDVRHPHSLPLELLAETGLVGALLAYGGIVLLVVAGVGGVRRLPAGAERGFAAALCAGAVAWLVHGVADWTWDVPGVTLPALVFLGVVAGRASAEDTPPAPDAVAGRSWWRRGIVLGAATLALALYAVSALAPAVADHLGSRSVESLQGPSPGSEELARAARDAQIAADLNPLASEPLVVSAAVAGRRGQRLQARGFLLDATRREPWSVAAWTALARQQLVVGDIDAARRAAARALELDPQGPQAARVAGAAASGSTRPARRSSAAPARTRARRAGG